MDKNRITRAARREGRVWGVAMLALVLWVVVMG